MKSKHLRILLVVAVTFTLSALAQTGSAATPSAPSSARPAAAGAPTPPVIAGTKVGAINMEGAIFGSNEGRRDLDAVAKKFEPKQAELKSQNDELESLKKQLTNTGDKLNPDALETLKKQIETKQKSFDRAYQDFQEEAGNQQQEIFSRLLPKIAPVLIKYTQENGFGLIIDTSKQWPQGPVLMAGQAFDITQPVVEMYNAQSGVPAQSPGAAKPAAAKPGASSGTAKPVAPKSADPAK